MKKITIAVLALFSIGLIAGVVNAESDKRKAKTAQAALRSMDIGQPLFFGGKNAKGGLNVRVGDFILMLQEDGYVTWRLTDEAIEQFRKEAEKGPKVEPAAPRPDYNSGKR